MYALVYLAVMSRFAVPIPRNPKCPIFLEFYDSPINPVQSHCRVPDIPIPESWECWRRPRHVPSVPLQSA